MTTERSVIYVVWTRSGSRRHAATAGSRYTFCGREHMGFVSPTSGAPAPRFAPHIARQDGTCRICIQEVDSERRRQAG
jgi:hypothetical protein